MSNWNIRDVDPETRKLIRVYAAENSITIAQALARLVRLIVKGKE